MSRLNLLSLNLKSNLFLFFFFNDTATTEIYTLSLHDALPISRSCFVAAIFASRRASALWSTSALIVWSMRASSSARCSSARSEEHTSELQSPCNLVCRLLLERKNNQTSHSVLSDTAAPHTYLR